MNQWLLNPDRLWSWPELREQQVLPKKPGIYGWYFQGLPKRVPISACHTIEGWSLTYVGIASSAQTLQRRISTHFTGNACGSTLRLSLGCLLSSELDIQLRRASGSGKRLTFALDEGERKLSSWMATHARVVFVEAEQPRTSEKELFRELNLPLNLEGNSQHPFHETLSNLRTEHRLLARSSSPLPARERTRSAP
ncbi:GIY-YIG nuclease family protein [Archangium gephyra]|uniref:GIY-YIG nuclease family protein n=1 Tax=Archangium gephyra TaxID=48 RepID=UPI003B76A71B